MKTLPLLARLWENARVDGCPVGRYGSRNLEERANFLRTTQELRDARQLAPGVSLLAYPPPYRCWLTLSNDPDNTTLAGWQELHRVIWQELALPFADSFFLFAYNDAIPDQVCVAAHPEILDAHPHDTMHTWGDYTMSESRLFSRREAQAGLDLLRQLGARPRIWTDHSDFIGNMLHRNTKGALPCIEDASGQVYDNCVYSLDLVRQAGVRYLWEGSNLTTVIGQDRPLGRGEWYRNQHGDGAKGRLLAWADRLGRPLLRRLQSPLLSFEEGINRQLYADTLADGQRFHIFRRYTHWPLADIDGFGEVIAPSMVERLIAQRGTAVIYTHLGKQRAGRRPDEDHIPPSTRRSLDHLAARHGDGSVHISATSKLLDYLVLRDAACFDDGVLDFRADGVRFERLTAADLAGHSFGLRSNESRPPTVRCEGTEVAVEWTEMAAGVWCSSFEEDYHV